MVHLQAAYFAERLFPRLRWAILDAPAGEFFVLGDRPVVWGFEGALEVKPALLRHPQARVIAPLTRTIALVAYHRGTAGPAEVRCASVNGVIASAATSWIAGPTEMVVRQALKFRGDA